MLTRQYIISHVGFVRKVQKHIILSLTAQGCRWEHPTSPRQRLNAFSFGHRDGIAQPNSAHPVGINVFFWQTPIPLEGVGA